MTRRADFQPVVELEHIYNMPIYKPKEHNKVALRVCKHCKMVAYTEQELSLFLSASNYKYGKRNICKSCYALKSDAALKGKPLTIVGPYCKLPNAYLQACRCCGLHHIPSNEHLFTEDKTICKTCKMLEKSKKLKNEKPTSVIVKSFITRSEMQELASITRLEHTRSPKDFLKEIHTMTSKDDQ